MTRRHSGSAGFSLAEVLVALAVAAMMAAMLTRFVAGTRANAVKIAELTGMVALGETLLARTASSQNLKPGRTEGRADSFAWRIDIAPVSFAAQALKIDEKTAARSDGAEGQANGSTGLGAGRAASGRAPRAGFNWVSYRVAVVIEAPSGQTYAIDTIRLGSGGRS